jgi:hypothetical protein
VDEPMGKEEGDDELEGKVSLGTYFRYIWGGNPVLMPILFVLYIFVQIVYMAVPFWLAEWSTQDTEEAQDPYYVEVLGIIVLILVVSSLARNILMN